MLATAPRAGFSTFACRFPEAACFTADFDFDWADPGDLANNFAADGEAARPAEAFGERADFPAVVPVELPDDRLDARAEISLGLPLESFRDDMPPLEPIKQADETTSYINESRYGCSYLSGCFCESRKTNAA